MQQFDRLLKRSLNWLQHLSPVSGQVGLDDVLDGAQAGEQLGDVDGGGLWQLGVLVRGEQVLQPQEVRPSEREVLVQW